MNAIKILNRAKAQEVSDLSHIISQKMMHPQAQALYNTILEIIASKQEEGNKQEGAKYAIAIDTKKCWNKYPIHILAEVTVLLEQDGFIIKSYQQHTLGKHYTLIVPFSVYKDAINKSIPGKSPEAAFNYNVRPYLKFVS